MSAAVKQTVAHTDDTFYEGWKAANIASHLSVSYTAANGTVTNDIASGDGSNWSITKVNNAANGALTVGSSNTIEVTGAGDYEGLTATLTVTAVADAVTGLVITAAPSKLSYETGDTFVKTGLAVTANYGSGNTDTNFTGYKIYAGEDGPEITDSTALSVNAHNGKVLTIKSGNVVATYGDEIAENVLTLAVTAKKITKPAVSGTYTYTGSSQSVVLTEVENASTYYTLSGNEAKTDAGTYPITATLKNPSTGEAEYMWDEGENEPTASACVLDWTIAKATVSDVTGAEEASPLSIYRMTGGSITVDPVAKLNKANTGDITISSASVTAVTSGAADGDLTVNKETANAVTITASKNLTVDHVYKVELQLTAAKNYKGTSGDSIKVTYYVKAVNKTPVAANDLSINLNDSYTYGTEITPSLTGSHLTGLTEANDLTAANSYTVSYQYKKQDAADDTYAATKPTDVGAYTVRATYEDNVPNGENSSIPGYAATLTKDFEIKQATNAIGGVTITGWTYGATANTPSITGATFGADTVTYKYYTDASCEMQTNTANSGATDNGGVPVNAGKYWVKASIAATDNYTAAAATKEFTIAKKSQTDLTATANIYYKGSLTLDPSRADGFPTEGIDDYTIKATGQLPTGITSSLPEGQKTATFTANLASATGTYNVSVTITSTNYADFTVTYTLTAIAKTPVPQEQLDITLSDSYTYGDAINPTLSGSHLDTLSKVESLDNANANSYTVSYEYKEQDAADSTYAATVPTDVGAYTVRATYEDNVANGENNSIPGYAATLTKNFTITPKDIGDTATVALASNDAITYDGTAKTPALTVKESSAAEAKTLTTDTDYTVTYANNTNAATANGTTGPYATVTFTGNYTGTKTFDFTIAPKPVSNDNLTATVTTATDAPNYDGAAHEPTMQYAWKTASTVPQPTTAALSYQVGEVSGTTYTGKLGSTGEKNGKPVGAGTYLVTATFSGNYTGTATAVFTIAPADNAQTVVTLDVPSEGYTYNGTAKEPTVTVKASNAAGAETLTMGAGGDYTVAYSDNTNAGSGKVTITFLGNYANTDTTKNTKVVTFKIAPATLKTIGSIDPQSYTGKAVTPTLTVSAASGTVAEKTGTVTNWTAVYADNTNVGTATVTVTGKGNYTGSVSQTFTIAAASATDATVTLTDGAPKFASGATEPSNKVNESTYTYDGTAKTPNALVVLGSGTDAVTLKEGVDYTLSYAKNTNAGTATATVTFKGNYTGDAKNVNFTIAKAQATSDKLNVTLDQSSYTYTGSAIEPTFTVTYDGKAVDKANYTVAYAGDATAGKTPGTLVGEKAVNVGDYLVKLTFQGNYEGSANVPFTIAKAARTVTVSPTSITLQKTDSVIGTATITVTDSVSGKTATFESSDTAVATVDTNGVVTAVAAGKANITVTPGADANYEDVAAITIPVTVTAEAVQTVSFAAIPTGNKVTFGAEDTAFGVTATAANSGDRTDAVVLTSSDTKVATIVENKVHIVGVGTTVIKASVPEYTESETTYLKAETDFTLTVEPKKIAVKWAVDGATVESASKSISYDKTGHTVSAFVAGLAEGVTYGGAVTTISSTEYHQITSGTNAGDYTATVTLSGAGANNYKLTNNSFTLTIGKIANAITSVYGLSGAGTYGSPVLAGAPVSANAAFTANGDTNEAVTLSYVSSDPNVLTVANDGKVTAVGNGTATVTVSAAASKNYEAAESVVVTFKVVKDSVNNIASASTDPDETYTATLDGDTLTFAGLVKESGTPTATATLTASYKDASGTGKTLTLTLTPGTDNKYTVTEATGGTLNTTADPATVTIDGITYKLDVTGVAKAPTAVKLAAGDPVVDVSSSGVAAADKTAAANVAKSVDVDGDTLIAAAATVADTAQQKATSEGFVATDTTQNAADAAIEKVKTAANSIQVQKDDGTGTKSQSVDWVKTINVKGEIKPNFEIATEVSVGVSVKDYTKDGSAIKRIGMEITPQYALVAKETDDAGNVIEGGNKLVLTGETALGEAKGTQGKDLGQAMPISVTMPAGFTPKWALHFPSNVTSGYAKEQADRWLPISYSGTLGTFSSRWFSYFGFEDENNTAVVVYHYVDGSTSAPTTLTAGDVGALPADPHTGTAAWRDTLAYTGKLYDQLAIGATSGTKLGLTTLAEGQEGGSIATPLDLYSTKLKTVTVNVTGGSYGSVTVNVDGTPTVCTSSKTIQVPVGANVTVTAAAGANGKQDSFTITGGATSSPFTMPDDDVTVTATFSSTSGDGSTTTSGGGGGGAENKISTASGIKNGSLSYSNANAKAGDTVTITPKPSKGYKLDTLVVKDNKGNEIPVTKNADGTYSFTMPSASKITVTPTFVEDKAETPTAQQFVDVPAGEYYADAVAWAVSKGITNGTSDTTFSPNASCTRAQVVTFLWRAAGCPEPTATSTKFTDLGGSDSYYFKAVQWAVEQGITNGTSDTTFDPNKTVTRGQVVTFLYRYEKASAGAGSAFTDVPAGEFYAPAVNWAVENKITNGTSNTTFSPANGCTRGQIVTFLYRDFVK